MNRKFRTIDSLLLPQESKIVVRSDLDVPIVNNKILLSKESVFRITASIATFKSISKKGFIPIVVGHLGRPTLETRKEFSMKSIAHYVGKEMKLKVYVVSLIDVPYTKNKKSHKYIDELSDTVFLLTKKKITSRLISYNTLKKGDLIFLENIRFWTEEEKNNLYFAQALACFGAGYINDAFATAHRVHASLYGITKYIQSAAGENVISAVREINRILYKSKKPLTCIVGGAKISTKIGVLKKLITIADYVLVGGGIANTFLVAMGHSIGKSVYEKSMIKTAKELLKKSKLYLPHDFVVVDSKNKKKRVITIQEGRIKLNKDEMILDIGPGSVLLFSKIIGLSKAIIWNGPVGRFEQKNASSGTFSLIKEVSKSNGFTLIGGGETVMALYRLNLEKRISYVSLGGGALLNFIEKGGNLLVINRLFLNRQ